MLAAGRGELDAGDRARCASSSARPPSPDALVKLGEVEQAAGRGDAARRHYARRSRSSERQGLADGAGIDAGVTL